VDRKKIAVHPFSPGFTGQPSYHVQKQTRLYAEAFGQNTAQSNTSPGNSHQTGDRWNTAVEEIAGSLGEESVAALRIRTLLGVERNMDGRSAKMFKEMIASAEVEIGRYN
jgi:hypothetical protein